MPVTGDSSRAAAGGILSGVPWDFRTQAAAQGLDLGCQPEARGSQGPGLGLAGRLVQVAHGTGSRAQVGAAASTRSSGLVLSC